MNLTLSVYIDERLASSRVAMNLKDILSEEFKPLRMGNSEN
jgi:hypothetical protein